MSKTAILVDGGFYRKRAATLWGKLSPVERAQQMINYCYSHLSESHTTHDLYRIFYYDCPPVGKKVFHPLLNRTMDMSKTDSYEWMNSFLQELKTKRKVALRLGSLDENSAQYTIKPDIQKKLFNGSITIPELTEDHFIFTINQKGVDMKIGIDIASLAYKKQIDQIVLIAGDSDFVPAAKLARREGIDFVLDPLGATIKPELFEHIDGKRSHYISPGAKPPIKKNKST